MKRRTISFLTASMLIISLAAIMLSMQRKPDKVPEAPPRWVLVIHGGAGTLTPERLSPDQQAAYLSSLRRALEIGVGILSQEGSALDAVEKVVRLLEDDSLFNAGRGAVLTAEGRAELDASIMDGSNLKAGAVAGVTTIRNPISSARMVMEKSPHVMMAGRGAEAFAAMNGAEIVDPSYFITVKSMDEYLKAKERLDKQGTVGAVALDMKGNLAAATSTGGMMMKRHGRIGDSPIIGAGTYADNATCAVSCTGHGEYFIRNAVAYDVGARMKYAGMPLAAAADTVIHGVLMRQGGRGGLIAVDRHGNYVMSFNTEGMFRGVAGSNVEAEVKIF